MYMEKLQNVIDVFWEWAVGKRTAFWDVDGEWKVEEVHATGGRFWSTTQPIERLYVSYILNNSTHSTIWRTLQEREFTLA